MKHNVVELVETENYPLLHQLGGDLVDLAPPLLVRIPDRSERITRMLEFPPTESLLLSVYPFPHVF